MLIEFPPIFAANTKLINDYIFVAPLILILGNFLFWLNEF